MQTISIHNHTFIEYLTATEIQAEVSKLAKKISEQYANTPPLFLSILNGSFMFAADLMRQLTIQPEIQFVKVSTYGNEMESSKEIKTFGLENLEIKDRHVIILEDIVDSGFTADFLVNHLQNQGVASLKLATLLYKPESFQGKYVPDFVCFEIPPLFVVGYGLDYAQKGRELGSIYQLIVNR